MNTEKVYKYPVFASLLALVIAVPIRIFQYFSILDPETGFFNEINVSVYIMYFVLAVAGIFSIAVPLINRKKIQTVSVCKKSVGFLIVSLIMAVTVVIDCANTLLTYFDLYSEATGFAMSVKEYVQSQGGTLLLLQAIFGGITAIFFFINGLAVGVGNSDGSKFKLLALVPTLWTMFRLLYRFKRTISFVNVSDLLFELFMIVFMMLYFLSFAQVISKIDASTVFYKTISYGLPAVMFAGLCFIPRFILTVIGKTELLCTHYTVNYSDFGFMVFAMYNFITRIKSKAPDTEIQNEE